MSLKVVGDLYNGTGNLKDPPRSLSWRGLDEERWSYPALSAQLGMGEVLVALFWTKPGENEDMKAAAILDEEGFREFRELEEQPGFLFQRFGCIPENAAREMGLL